MSTEGGKGLFPTTNWIDIAALRNDDAHSREALERLCSAYWFPVFAFIRRQTPDVERARDLTQGFFQQLLEKGSLSRLSFEGGRFRSFLLTACRHFLADAYRYENRQIRRPIGGLVDVESAELEGKYASSLRNTVTPEQIFEKEWAFAAIARSFQQVESDYKQRKRGELFALLQRYLDEDPDALTHRESAEQLGMSEGSIKVELLRLRQRLRSALQAEVAATLSDPGASESELAILLQAVSGKGNL